MQSIPTVILRAGKEEPLLRRHPWVFSGAIAHIDGQPDDGDLVRVKSKRGDLLGVGHYHNGSIAVRVIGPADADPAQKTFWVEKFADALRLRRQLGLSPTPQSAYRLVHGEGDGLSGLVIDVYGSAVVVQCHSIGMHRQRALIAEALRSTLGPACRLVFDKSVEALPSKYAENHQNTALWSAENDPFDFAVVEENGVQFKVDWATGQKTGFFLDQRENRALLARFAPGKSVLNTFCYTGGFSCYALRAGATLVHSVDVSAKAMELTAENVALNGDFSDRHNGYTADVLRFFRENERLYDLVVVDPPAFAKSMDKRHNAVQGYKRLNAAALQRVEKGGLMFTFSCSQVIDRELFYHTIAAAAMEAGRPVRVLHHLSQGPDHPVSLFHPEGSYLKGLVLEVG